MTTTRPRLSAAESGVSKLRTIPGLGEKATHTLLGDRIRLAIETLPTCPFLPLHISHYHPSANNVSKSSRQTIGLSVLLLTLSLS